MHEMSIATELHRACRREIAQRGGGRLRCVEVEVGELSGVEPELLRFAWEALAAGTPDAEAAIEITWCPARQECSECGPVASRQPGRWLRLCPGCGSPLKVEGGQQLDIVRISFDPVVTAGEVRA